MLLPDLPKGGLGDEERRSPHRNAEQEARMWRLQGSGGRSGSWAEADFVDGGCAFIGPGPRAGPGLPGKGLQSHLGSCLHPHLPPPSHAPPCPCTLSWFSACLPPWKCCLCIGVTAHPTPPHPLTPQSCISPVRLQRAAVSLGGSCSPGAWLVTGHCHTGRSVPPPHPSTSPTLPSLHFQCMWHFILFFFFFSR